MANPQSTFQNIFSPPIMFFIVGAVATFSGSQLDVPNPLPKLFSIYLLLSIGFNGGVELEEIGIQREVVLLIVAALTMSMFVPIYAFFILRKRLDESNSAAIAASYGSISAVTFITAQSFLSVTKTPYDGFMVAALALMETPAIIVGMIFLHSAKEKAAPKNWYNILREAVLNESVYILLCSLIVGLLTNKFNKAAVPKMDYFTKDLFYGSLCIFLLDMGMLAAKHMREMKRNGMFLTLFAIGVPVINAVISIFISYILQFSKGNALLFAVLCGSASYIAVPAVMREAAPKANPSLYLGTSIGITFPFNIIFGIPLYMILLEQVGMK